MLVKHVIDIAAGPIFGVAILADDGEQRGIWTELGVVGILAMLLWQVTQYVLEGKRHAAYQPESHVLHDKICEDMAEGVEQLIVMHHDPNSGFSTLFLKEQVKQLIDLQKDILAELRKHTP